MAKRKIELFIEIHNEKEFENTLLSHSDQLICAEIYCSFAGSCTALDRLFTTIKLDWSSGKIVLLKVPADEIEALKRFRDHSEPVYMFIVNHRVCKVFRGVDNLRFAELAKQEWTMFKEGVEIPRATYEISEATPDEADWLSKKSIDKKLEMSATSAKRAARQAARKRHRAELMVPHLQNLNFVLFWPHCFHAHPELYEKWDINNIIMVGREEVQLTQDTVRDVLYAGDAPMNEASLHQLLSAPALAICFRLLDTDKHFVSLVRRILYEELPEFDESKPAGEQRPRMTAFEYYKTFSPTREEVEEMRRRERIQRKEDVIEQRARRLSEMQRLARQAIEDALEAQRMAREQRRLELLKSGNLCALKEFDEEPDSQISIVVPEELPDEYVEEIDEELPREDEYLPPPGLMIPGFYAPPNDVAKVNGLAILFPKLVLEHVNPEPEFLPPHVLVLLEISKRYKAIEAIAPYKTAIIHMGIFEASSPYDSKHLAYSVTQFDTVDTSSMNQEQIKIAFMLSIEKDLPLLQLVDLIPTHVSRDTASGGDECASMFPHNYGDHYPEFEDFDVPEEVE